MTPLDSFSRTRSRLHQILRLLSSGCRGSFIDQLQQLVEGAAQLGAAQGAAQLGAHELQPLFEPQQRLLQNLNFGMQSFGILILQQRGLQQRLPLLQQLAAGAQQATGAAHVGAQVATGAQAGAQAGAAQVGAAVQQAAGAAQLGAAEQLLQLP